MMTRLWRGEHPDRPSDGTCWAPDPCSALSFLVAGGLDGRGRLLEAELDDDAVAICPCEGIEASKPGPDDVALPADDPAYRAKYAAQGYDVLLYMDGPALSVWWDSDRQQAVTHRLRRNCDRVHLRHFVCWRMISPDGHAALLHRGAMTVDSDVLTMFVRQAYPPCSGCGKIPLEIGGVPFCADCMMPANLKEKLDGLPKQRGA